ncbi:hypothetical protein T484DRAFT_1884617, partial [Baffinella frigidus]
MSVREVADVAGVPGALARCGRVVEDATARRSFALVVVAVLLSSMLLTAGGWLPALLHTLIILASLVLLRRDRSLAAPEGPAPPAVALHGAGKADAPRESDFTGPGESDFTGPGESGFTGPSESCFTGPAPRPEAGPSLESVFLPASCEPHVRGK